MMVLKKSKKRFDSVTAVIILGEATVALSGCIYSWNVDKKEGGGVFQKRHTKFGQ